MEPETLYIVGESRTNLDNAITKMYGSFYIAFEMEAQTGKVVDLGCTHSLEITERFLRKIFIGHSIESDYNELEKELTRRYYGSSQKAVLASMKDAHKKYQFAKLKLNTL